MKNILVVFGGKSVEHDISIITGLGVVTNTSSAYNVIPVYIDKQGNWWTGEKLKDIQTFKNWDTKGLKPCAILPNNPSLVVFGKFGRKQTPVFCAVNCFHGHDGEDGAVQGVFRLSKIPSTSPSVVSSAVCMDKTIAKQVLNSNKIKTVDYVCFDQNEYKTHAGELFKKVEAKLGFPCIIKPNSLGSSIGVNVAKNEKECQKYVELALHFDNEVLIEKYLDNARELNIAVWRYNNNLMLSSIEEVKIDNKVYNFEDKYKSKNIERVVPAKIDEAVLQDINKCATKAYNALKCCGIVRFDFLLSNEVLYLNEVNTIPGSLACYLWKEPKIPYNTLLTKLIENSVLEFEKEKNRSFDFESHVLDNLVKDNFKMTK